MANIINLKGVDGDYNIPVEQMSLINLEKYMDRTAYSDIMTEKYDNIESVWNQGNNNYHIRNTYNDKKFYYLEELGSSYDKERIFNKFFQNGVRWFVLHKPHEMIALIAMDGVLCHEKHPYRFYNDVVRTIEVEDDGKIVASTSGGKFEKEFHFELFNHKKRGLNNVIKSWGGSKKYADLSHVVSHGEYKDYSDVYHSNDSVFFVGNRGQVFDLVLRIVNDDKNCIFKSESIGIGFYDILKNLKGGVISKKVKLNSEFSIDVNNVKIPIVEKASGNRLIFYKHNFDKHEDVVKKDLNIDDC